MSPPEGIDSLSREELLTLVLQLQHKLIELEANVLDLRAEVDRLTREKKRQAAPFSKGTRAQQPKRPGRKPHVGGAGDALRPSWNGDIFESGSVSSLAARLEDLRRTFDQVARRRSDIVADARERLSIDQMAAAISAAFYQACGVAPVIN